VIRSAGSADYKLFRETEFDRVLDTENLPKDQLHWAALCDLLRNADVWFAYFDSLFFPIRQHRMNDLAFGLIRMVGIRVVVMAHGMDVLYRMPSVTRFDWVGRAQDDYPDWDLTAAASDVRWRTNLFCSRSEVVIADPICARFMPRCDINFKWLTIDSIPNGREPGITDVPVIVHAPQHRRIKGTDYLVEAVADLRSRGFMAELRLIERLSRHEALNAYADADIIADQFIIGSYGMFALEGLALGKPVLTYLDEQHLGNPAYDLPIVNTNPYNIRQVLAALLRVPVLRVRLGRVARLAAERHTPRVMSELWREIATSAWRKERPDLSHAEHFRGRAGRPFTENPMDEDFWPVAVTDILHEIQAAVTAAGERSGEK
jgi:hypothetical protein